jgi:hypothetical protein
MASFSSLLFRNVHANHQLLPETRVRNCASPETFPFREHQQRRIEKP